MYRLVARSHGADLARTSGLGTTVRELADRRDYRYDFASGWMRGNFRPGSTNRNAVLPLAMHCAAVHIYVLCIYGTINPNYRAADAALISSKAQRLMLLLCSQHPMPLLLLSYNLLLMTEIHQRMLNFRYGVVCVDEAPRQTGKRKHESVNHALNHLSHRSNPCPLQAGYQKRV